MIKMSTNGLIGIRTNGEMKATYNHFDSQPEELGKNVVNFIVDLFNDDKIEELKLRFGKVRFVDRKSTPTSNNIIKYAKYANLGVSLQTYREWYCLLRLTQGIEGFKCVFSGDLKHMEDFTGAIELTPYAYILNFDNDTVEFYDCGDIRGSIKFSDLARNEHFTNGKWIKAMYPE